MIRMNYSFLFIYVNYSYEYALNCTEYYVNSLRDNKETIYTHDALPQGSNETEIEIACNQFTSNQH